MNEIDKYTLTMFLENKNYDRYTWFIPKKINISGIHIGDSVEVRYVTWIDQYHEELYTFREIVSVVDIGEKYAYNYKCPIPAELGKFQYIKFNKELKGAWGKANYHPGEAGFALNENWKAEFEITKVDLSDPSDPSDPNKPDCNCCCKNFPCYKKCKYKYKK